MRNNAFSKVISLAFGMMPSQVTVKTLIEALILYVKITASFILLFQALSIMKLKRTIEQQWVVLWLNKKGHQKGEIILTQVIFCFSTGAQ